MLLARRYLYNARAGLSRLELCLFLSLADCGRESRGEFLLLAHLVDACILAALDALTSLLDQCIGNLAVCVLAGIIASYFGRSTTKKAAMKAC